MSRAERWTILLLAAAGLLYLLRLLPAAPILEADSASYLGFFPLRSAGYPLFLALLGVSGAVWVQPLLYATALSWLGWESGQTIGWPPAGLLVAAGAMVSPALNRYHATILSESLFMSLLVLFLALLLRILRRPGWRAAAAASLVAGLAATVRPNAYALLPVLALLPLLCRSAGGRGRAVLLAAALLPMLLLVATERTASHLYHGAAANSLAGRHFYAKAALLEAPPPPLPASDPQRRRLEAAQEEGFAAIRRLLPQLPRWDAREALSEDYETCLEYACLADLRQTAGLSEPAFDALALRVGLDRIGRAPLAFLALWGERLRSLWTLSQNSAAPAAMAYNRFLAEHQPLPFAAVDSDLSRPAVVRPHALLLRGVILALGAATALLALLVVVAALSGRRRGDAALNGAGLAALAIHGSQLLTALVGVGIPRYTLSLWPAMVLAVVLSLGWCLRRAEPCKS